MRKETDFELCLMLHAQQRLSDSQSSDDTLKVGASYSKCTKMLVSLTDFVSLFILLYKKKFEFVQQLQLVVHLCPDH